MNPTDSLNRPLDAPIEGEHSLRALGRAALDRVNSQASQGAHDASEALQLRAHHLADQWVVARDSGSEIIRAHPLRSVAVAAGVGAGLMLIVSLLLRLRSHS